MKTKPASLKDIPFALFEEYGNPATIKSSSRTDGPNRLSISIARVSHLNFKHMFLVYTELFWKETNENVWVARLYPSEVDFKIFNLYGESEVIDPLISIWVEGVRPSPESDTEDMEWVQGRGFWIAETLQMQVGGPNTSNFTTTIVGTGLDILQHFLVLEMAKSAYQYGLDVKITGHWEYDWNPGGQYQEKPPKIR